MAKLGGPALTVGGGEGLSLDVLRDRAEKTTVGQKLREEKALREKGEGLPHTDAKIRLFGTGENPKITLYRDSAAWCPYCQKTWMLFEEKRVPFRIEKINMRSYGDKPKEFLAKVPGGLLPVIEVEGGPGQPITESQVIMNLVDRSFPESAGYRDLMPPKGTPLFKRAQELLSLERDLFRAWCGYVFYPPGFGGGRDDFDRVMDRVDAALGETEGPWFLGGTEPSLVDLTYVPHVERIAASVAYWKGRKVRGGKWKNVDRWFDALDERPSYQATKGDFYTHVMDIPPQYGDGFFERGDADYKSVIEGKAENWRLPLPPVGPSDLEPVIPSANVGDEAARHHAAWKLLSNFENVVRFSCRGVGAVGQKKFSAPLADPYAVPNEDAQADVNVALQYVVMALLQGAPQVKDKLNADLAAGGDSGTRRAVAACLHYLRDRVGVPRDMPYLPARQLRAHLNWVADAYLEGSAPAC